MKSLGATMPGIAQWLPWHLLTIQSMCFDCFGWEWELQLMNHTVSFIHSASPLMESIHKCGLIVSTRARTHSYTHACVPACPHTLTVHPQHSSLKDSHCWSNPPTPPWCTCKVNMYKRQTGKVIGGVFLSSASAWQQSHLFVASVGLDFPAPMELVLSVCAPLVS